ncbi:IS3 family transposase [Phytohabitans suffuscus]|nr:IS3 family transposase [Phytohabitans suffuscus]
MLRWLGVSGSGYYEWRRRPQSATAARREALKKLIMVIFEMSDQTYGYRRIHAALRRSGHGWSPELVRALVRQLGPQPCQPRPWRHNLTDQDPAARRIPDLLRRDLTATAPGVKMVGSGSRREFHPPAPTEPCFVETGESFVFFLQIQRTR